MTNMYTEKEMIPMHFVLYIMATTITSTSVTITAQICIAPPTALNAVLISVVSSSDGSSSSSSSIKYYH